MGVILGSLLVFNIAIFAGEWSWFAIATFSLITITGFLATHLIEENESSLFTKFGFLSFAAFTVYGIGISYHVFTSYEVSRSYDAEENYREHFLIDKYIAPIHHLNFERYWRTAIPIKISETEQMEFEDALLKELDQR